jgi:hypothetical protein
METFVKFDNEKIVELNLIVMSWSVNHDEQELNQLVQSIQLERFHQDLMLDRLHLRKKEIIIRLI